MRCSRSAFILIFEIVKNASYGGVQKTNNVSYNIESDSKSNRISLPENELKIERSNLKTALLFLLKHEINLIRIDTNFLF